MIFFPAVLYFWMYLLLIYDWSLYLFLYNKKKNDTGTVYQSLTFENCLVHRKHMGVLLVYPFCSQYNKYVVRFSLLSLKNNRIKKFDFLEFWDILLFDILPNFHKVFIEDEHDISFSSILGFLQMFCYVHVAKGSWVLASPWGLIFLLELNLLHDFCFFSRTLKCLRISECRLGIEHVFLLSCARSIKLV